MKDLDHIPKKEVFKVPDGYFESLPLLIQTRISADKQATQPGFILRYRLQYALPVIALLAISIYWFAGQSPSGDPETILASVHTEELVAYLNNSELTTDDLLEDVDFNEQDIQEIESEVYEFNFGNENVDEVPADFDIENI